MDLMILKSSINFLKNSFMYATLDGRLQNRRLDNL